MPRPRAIEKPVADRAGRRSDDALRAATLEIADPTGRLGGVAWLRDHAQEGLAALGARGEVRVRIVDDEEMAAAHRRWAGVCGTTDVLTFDYAEQEPPEPGSPTLDADILVCFDEAARQGAARGHSAAQELLLYVIHGVLHCLGHDDHDEASAAAMHRREDEILAQIGVGATYVAPAERRDSR